MDDTTLLANIEENLEHSVVSSQYYYELYSSLKKDNKELINAPNTRLLVMHSKKTKSPVGMLLFSVIKGRLIIRDAKPFGRKMTKTEINHLFEPLFHSAYHEFTKDLKFRGKPISELIRNRFVFNTWQLFKIENKLRDAYFKLGPFKTILEERNLVKLDANLQVLNYIQENFFDADNFLNINSDKVKNLIFDYIGLMKEHIVDKKPLRKKAFRIYHPK